MKNKLILIILSMLLSISFISCNNSSIKTSDVKTGTDTKTTNDNKEVLPIDNTKDFEETSTSEGTNKTKTEKTIKVYFYDGVEDKIFFTNETAVVTDGALVTAIIDLLKKDRGENFCTLPPDLGVKGAKLDKANDKISVNFGGKFVNNMNLGSGSEINVLQSIVNSIGYNFGVSNVYITVDGAEYSSGHILMESNEAFKVNYENTTEIK